MRHSCAFLAGMRMECWKLSWKSTGEKFCKQEVKAKTLKYSLLQVTRSNQRLIQTTSNSRAVVHYKIIFLQHKWPAVLTWCHNQSISFTLLWYWLLVLLELIECVDLWRQQEVSPAASAALVNTFVYNFLCIYLFDVASCIAIQENLHRDNSVYHSVSSIISSNFLHYPPVDVLHNVYGIERLLSLIAKIFLGMKEL